MGAEATGRCRVEKHGKFYVAPRKTSKTKTKTFASATLTASVRMLLFFCHGLKERTIYRVHSRRENGSLQHKHEERTAPWERSCGIWGTASSDCGLRRSAGQNTWRASCRKLAFVSNQLDSCLWTQQIEWRCRTTETICYWLQQDQRSSRNRGDLSQEQAVEILRPNAAENSSRILIALDSITNSSRILLQ